MRAATLAAVVAIVLSACTSGAAEDSATTPSSTTSAAASDATTTAARLAPVLAAVSSSREAITTASAAFTSCWRSGAAPCAASAEGLAVAVQPLLTIGPKVPDLGIATTSTPAGTMTPAPASDSTGNLMQNTYDSARTITDQSAALATACVDRKATACSTALNAVNDAAAVLDGNLTTWGTYLDPATVAEYVKAIDEYRSDLQYSLDLFAKCEEKTPDQCADTAAGIVQITPMLIVAIGGSTTPPAGTSLRIGIPERRLGPPPASITPLVARTVGAAYAANDAMRIETGRCTAPDAPCPIGEAELATVAPKLSAALAEWDTVKK